MSRTRTSLAQRFYLFIFFFIVAGTLAWGLLAVSSSVSDQRRGTSQFLDESEQRVDEVLDRTADGQAELMDQAVKRLSGNLGRELEDVPFEVFEGRSDLLLAFLKERLDDGRRRNEENSRAIAGLFRKEARDLAHEKLAELEEQHREGAEELIRSLRRALLLWGGAFLVGVGLLVGFVFHRAVVVPLRDATEVIETLGSGDMSSRMPQTDSVEIDRLAVSFNTMAEQIESQHRSLEEKVIEKTAALRASLDEQQRTNDALRRTVEELESTQRQLVESEKMAALGTMARGMAHEFNNILGGVAGLAEDLARDIEDPDSRRVLEVIRKTSRRALVITENLQRFSHGSAHARTVTDLSDVLRESLSLVEPEAARRGVILDQEGGPVPNIVTDARGLQQVFLNLLINAVHACGPEGGRVTARILETEEGQQVVVEDNGVGVAAEHLDRIFEPFFTTKDQEEGAGGTGLGLSVARGIVENLGGRLTAASQGAGQGSRFIVEVPGAPAA